MPRAVDLAETLGAFSERFAPRTVAEFNGHDVMAEGWAWQRLRRCR